MKKYIAPEVEIKRFAVENIMTDSTADAVVSDDTSLSTVTEKQTVTYGELFNLN